MPLAIQNLCKSFGEKKVLRGISHVFPEKGACMVGGPSGCGKTTLLRILMGIEQADSGEIHMPAGAKIAAVFQEDRLIAHYTAAANIRLTSSCSQREIDEALGILGLSADQNKPVREFSGGMQRRVAIARAVLHRPDVLFLDEPFTGLDENMRETAAKFIVENMRGGLIVVVTHDREEAKLLGCTDELSLKTEA